MWLSILNKTSKRVRMNDLVQYRNIIKKSQKLALM